MTRSVKKHESALRRVVAIALCSAAFAACSKVSEKTVAQRPRPTHQAGRNYEQLEREARGAFLSDPRDVKTVELSAQKYKEALAIRADDYETLWESARSCMWLGYYGREAKRQDYVQQGLEYANTAVKLKPRGEEGLFYHGALAGRLAELNFKYSADAIKIIESRMLELIENKSTFFYGGPDRVLAIVYMRAPGAPLSVGDYDKSLAHMQRALHIESHWLENQLYMAELEFRLGKKKSDPASINSARKRLQDYFLKPGAKPSMALGSAFEFKEWQKVARKLMEKYA